MITETGKLFLINTECVVGDPCYFDSCRYAVRTVKDLVAGSYKTFVDKGVRGIKKGRIKELFIVHEGFENETLFEEEIDCLGVDSGQMGIYITDIDETPITTEEIEASRNKEFPYDDWRRDISEADTLQDKFYKVCCNHTLCKDNYGNISDKAVVSSSGYGDGVYPLYLLRDKYGNKVGVKVRFIK